MEPLRILTGQTASGKSTVAVRLAEMMNAELISVDSIKVHRGLDIGTAKPSRAVREKVRFHLLDVVDSGEAFSLARYLREAHAAVAEIRARGCTPLFVGGTPLYLRGLLYGVFEGPGADWAFREELQERARREGPNALHDELRRVDPVTAQRLHPNDHVRIIRALEVACATGRPISAHQRQYPAPAPAVPYRMVALRREEADLKARIRARVAKMFEAGLIEEVRRVVEGPGLSISARKAIGYQEALRHLAGELGLAETVAEVERNTWRLARKQRGWLKSFPGVMWLDVAPQEEVGPVVERARRLLFDAGSQAAP
jgi:tRNA dimethylallyltransferase